MGSQGIARRDQEFLGQLLRFINLDTINNELKRKFIENPYKIDLSSVLTEGLAAVSDKKRDNKILHLLTPNEKPVIKATTGQRFLAKAKNAFRSGVDSNFKNWNLDKTSHETFDVPVDVHELVTDATFAQIFGSLSDDLNKLCLTQDQIEEFCLEHRSWLRKDGYATFFLFKEDEQFFVVNVDINPDGLDVSVDRFEYGRVWNGSIQLRVVVPQL